MDKSMDVGIWQELLEALEDKRLERLEAEFDGKEEVKEEYKIRKRIYGILRENLPEEMMEHIQEYGAAGDTTLADAEYFFYHAGFIDGISLIQSIFCKCSRPN